MERCKYVYFPHGWFIIFISLCCTQFMFWSWDVTQVIPIVQVFYRRDLLTYLLTVKVTHLNCTSYINTDIAQVYITHEKQKKRKYNERVIQVEKGTFSPIVMSTSGGMGIEAEKFHKRLAHLIAEKKGETYSSVMNFIRTRLRFCLLKSVLTSIRGIRGKKETNNGPAPISSLSFNLIEYD